MAPERDTALRRPKAEAVTVASEAARRVGTEQIKVVALGALTPAADFVRAAVETNADAIMVSSLYGQGELDCRGFRDLCVEAGLDDILVYVGGNLVVGKQTWEEVEQRFVAMGFDRAVPPGTRTDDVIRILAEDFAARERKASEGR